MGESWGDLVAGEYMFSHGYPNGGNPWAVGVYATGNKTVAHPRLRHQRQPAQLLRLRLRQHRRRGARGRRDLERHAVERAPGAGHEARRALTRTPTRRLQLSCAQGTATSDPRARRAAALCPGNRRWVQLMFDAFLLQQGATSMLDARDAMLAADRMRFGGEDEKRHVAGLRPPRHGPGRRRRRTPTPATPEAQLRLAPGAQRHPALRRAGQRRGLRRPLRGPRTPVADTDPATGDGPDGQLAPGRYEMLYVSRSRGFSRFTRDASRAGQHAHRSPCRHRGTSRPPPSGAKVIGSQRGLAQRGRPHRRHRGDQLGRGHRRQRRRRAALRVRRPRRRRAHGPPGPGQRDAATRAPRTRTPLPARCDDPDAGSRFTALRRFALEACVTACSSPAATWTRFYTSSGRRVPGSDPAPGGAEPDAALASTSPTPGPPPSGWSRWRTSAPAYAGYAGEQDADPTNDTDCATASDRGTIVHAAELQVY